MGVHKALWLNPPSCMLPTGQQGNRLTAGSPSFPHPLWDVCMGVTGRAWAHSQHSECGGVQAGLGWAVGTRDKTRTPGSLQGTAHASQPGTAEAPAPLSLRNGAHRFHQPPPCPARQGKRMPRGPGPHSRALKQQGVRHGEGQSSQKRDAFFLSSFRFHRASLLNSSGDMAKTLEKSSADRCLSSLIRSTPGGSLVLPLLVTTSIS